MNGRMNCGPMCSQRGLAPSQCRTSLFSVCPTSAFVPSFQWFSNFPDRNVIFYSSRMAWGSVPNRPIIRDAWNHHQFAINALWWTLAGRVVAISCNDCSAFHRRLRPAINQCLWLVRYLRSIIDPRPSVTLKFVRLFCDVLLRAS